MKYLREYKLFERHEDIHDICKKYSITNYTINSDGSIDVNGNVNMRDKRLTKLPLKFRNVSGYLLCRNNQLTSLKGSPQHVGRDFYCNDNQLTSLEGAPQNVSDDFSCSLNKLISLEGAPKRVGGNFYCNNNQLMSLEGSPKHVGGNFWCRNNQLTSLEGAPQSLGGNFYCQDTPVYYIWILFEDYSKIELLNDYDCLRELDGKPSVIIDRLNDFLQEIGKEKVEKVKDWINI